MQQNGKTSWLLCARGKGPRDGRTTEKRDEFPPSHRFPFQAETTPYYIIE